MNSLIKHAIFGTAVKVGLSPLSSALDRFWNIPTKDDIIIEKNKEKMLQYYYNDIIQGQAP